mmetsp:Transcript_54549/g.130132  ORF Transcript_54549/g.130132 Transcript_54549/m.130132 type:complete len:231 (+) Transcript_54549:717-1409(+)
MLTDGALAPLAQHLFAGSPADRSSPVVGPLLSELRREAAERVEDLQSVGSRVSLICWVSRPRRSHCELGIVRGCFLVRLERPIPHPLLGVLRVRLQCGNQAQRHTDVTRQIVAETLNGIRGGDAKVFQGLGHGDELRGPMGKPGAHPQQCLQQGEPRAGCRQRDRRTVQHDGATLLRPWQGAPTSHMRLLLGRRRDCRLADFLGLAQGAAALHGGAAIGGNSHHQAAAVG